MKNLKASLTIFPALLLFLACSKGNEHLSRDLYTLPIPVGFEIPAISSPDSTKELTAFTSTLNLDSLIKSVAGAEFGASDIEAIKLTGLRMDVVDFDTTYNFRLVDSLQVRLWLGTDTTTILAQSISNPDISADRLNPILSGIQPDLKHYVNNGSFSYLLTGRIRTATTQPLKATLTAQYKLTIGR